MVQTAGSPRLSVTPLEELRLRKVREGWTEGDKDRDKMESLWISIIVHMEKEDKWNTLKLR